MSSTALITQALNGSLKPATVEAELTLSMATLSGNVRPMVETAIEAGWPGELVEIVWSGNQDLAQARAYVHEAEGSHLAGTLTFGGSSDRFDAVIATEGGCAGLKLDHEVLQAVLA